MTALNLRRILTDITKKKRTKARKRAEQQTRWHQLLGKEFELLLTVVDIIVQTEIQVMSEPPKADILLLRRMRRAWTAAQKARLPDGVRDSKARHILLEFKYTESLTLETVLQAASYDYLYRKAQQLTSADVQTFVLCAKTPRAERLTELGYVKTEQAGVYRSENVYVRTIPLLVLNELADTPHNAFVKCFASRKDAKAAAFTMLDQHRFDNIPWLLYIFLTGLRHLWSIPEGEEPMKEKVTPERVLEMGEEWAIALLQKVNPEERVARLSLEERLFGISPQEVLAHYKPEEVLAQYKPEEVLAQYKPEERLAGLSVEEVEAWLAKQRSTQAKAKRSKPHPPKKN